MTRKPRAIWRRVRWAGLASRCARRPAAAEGVDAARQYGPHLILLDINLPDMSGWDVMKALAADPLTRDIPIVVHSVEDDRPRAIKAGACDLLVKPVDRDLLTASALRFARAPEPETNQPAAYAAGQSTKKTA
ncbi:MAG: response regulator [Hyphomonadaceae bacterium]